MPRAERNRKSRVHQKYKRRSSDKSKYNKKYRYNKKIRKRSTYKKSKKKCRGRIDKLNKINQSHFPSGFKTTVLYENPYIVKIRRFLNTEEINTILGMAEGKFEKSTIVVDGEMVLSNVRTSETAFITDNGHFDDYSKPVDKILKKVCYLAGCKRNQVESLMVVKYGEGEEYYNHHDYFKPEHTDVIKDGGQRVGTFFCYLNSLDSGNGGETEFPLIGVKTKPSKGNAIFWWDVNSSGELLKNTLHRGNPVKKGIKYGLNIWVRETGW